MNSSYGSLYSSARFDPQSDVSRRSFNCSAGAGGGAGDASFRRDYSGLSFRGKAENSGFLQPLHLTQIGSQAPAEKSIDTWFHEKINPRLRTAALSLFTVVLAALCAVALAFNVSLWHPLLSLQGVFYLLINPFSWLIVLAVAGLVSFGLVHILHSEIFSPSNETIRTLDRGHLSKAAVTFAVLNGILLVVAVLLSPTVFTLESAARVVFFVAVSVVTAFKVFMENSFRYEFATDRTIHFKELLRWLGTRIAYNFRDTVVRTVQAVALGATITLAIVLLLLAYSPWSTLLYLLDPMLWAHGAVFSLVCFLLADSACFIVNTTTMDSVDFPMPSPYFFAEQRDESVNLINGMSSKSDLIRLFAFRDFVIKAENPSICVGFYVLSQPGNHPRLWDAVSGLAVGSINHVKEQLTKVTKDILVKQAALLQQSPLADAANDGDGRARQVIPRNVKAKRHHYPNAKAPVWINLAPFYAKFNPVVSTVRNYLFPPTPVVPSINCDLATYAIHGLGLIVATSVTEDRYGVVLNSVNRVVSAILGVATACDQYFRARGFRSSATSEHDVKIFEVYRSAFEACSEICRAYADHLDDLRLPAERLALLVRLAEGPPPF